MLFTPSMPEMLSSRGCVTCDSMTCGLAPLYTVRTDTTGVSIFGYSRTVRRRKEITPIRMMRRLITVARTGRLIESSGRNMNQPPRVGDKNLKTSYERIHSNRQANPHSGREKQEFLASPLKLI